jgi:hypothetical protein
MKKNTTYRQSRGPDSVLGLLMLVASKIGLIQTTMAQRMVFTAHKSPSLTSRQGMGELGRSNAEEASVSRE